MHWFNRREDIVVSAEMMREFVALARTLNFTKAAQECFVAQPTLSRHIAALEKEMGAQLVERSTTSVALTPAGEATFAAFEEMLAEIDKVSARYDRLLEQIAAMASGGKAAVRIATPYYWTSAFTEPLLDEMRAESTGYATRLISCQPSDGFQALVTGKCDALVMPSSWLSTSKGLESISFGRLGTIALMDVSNPLARRGSVKAEDLVGAKLIQLDDPQGMYRGLTEKMLDLLATAGIAPSSLEYELDLESLGMRLRGTDKMTLTSEGVELLARSYLTAVPVLEPGWQYDMSLVWHKGDQNPAVMALANAASAIRARGGLHST